MRLRPYQRDFLAWHAEHLRALLADQPGLGKTPQALHVTPPTHGRAVVCPKAALGIWRDEPAKWGLGGTVEILRGRGSWRWPRPGETLILNYAILPWTPRQIREAEEQGKKYGAPIGKPSNPVHLIFDECQALRKNKSLQHVRARALARKADIVTGLTGTPVGGSPFDLYHMLGALGCRPPEWTWFTFLRRFNAYELPHGGYDFARNAAGEILVDPRVREELRGVMLRRLRVDVASELPPKIYRYVNVEHKPATKRALAALGARFAPHFDTDKLPDITEFAHTDRMISEERIPLIKPAQIEREERGERGLMFCPHVAPVLAAGSRTGWGAIHGAVPQERREELVRLFEAGKLQGLALQLKTAATALNIPSADYATFISRSWDPDEQEQAEDRANRLTRTKGPINIEIWTSQHPVSVHRSRILSIKAALAGAVLGEG